MVAERQLNIFAKGNLDLRDSLHSYKCGNRVAWNGINEILRLRFPACLARVRHETWTRSDALLAAGGEVPQDLGARQLPLGPYPLASQFSNRIFEASADVFVLSIQPDLTNLMARHRRDGYLLFPNAWQSWSPAARQWLTEEFAPLPLLGTDQSMANLFRIVGRIRRHSSAPILIYNFSATVPGEHLHCYQGLEETFSTRVRRFNLGLIELSEQLGISVIDVDAVLARAGADRLKLDSFHVNVEGNRLVAEEVVSVLADLGCLSPER